MWRALGPPLRSLRHTTRWIRGVPSKLNSVRDELGLPPLGPERGITTYGALSAELVMVATFPQLEYPRRWPTQVRVTGPMLFEPPCAEVELPEGDEPLVVVAASTVQDPDLGLLRTAFSALESEPVRVVATMSRRGEAWPGPVPENATVVDWVSYDRVLPKASLVISRGGHGTVAAVLAGGVPMLVCPVSGDMPENAARVAWAGAGLMLPRHLLSPGPMRWAVRRLLSDPRFAARARAIAEWSRENDGAAHAADLVERFATG
jgi:MGT family glycosyltransferase